MQDIRPWWRLVVARVASDLILLCLQSLVLARLASDLTLLCLQPR